MKIKDIKKIKEWLEGILVIEYKKDKKSELRLENIMEIFENGN